MATEDIYARYEAYVRRCVESGNLTFFKSVPEYNYMLEQLPRSEGLKYYTLLRTKGGYSDDVIREFCERNDAVGMPNKGAFPFGSASPTSLRYLYQAHLIVAHMKVKMAGAPVSVVEVGGGYGGLAHAISFLASRVGVQIASYAIVDLEPVAELQRLYLEKVGLNFPFQTYSSGQYGADVPGEGLFLISNYCFSEIQRHHQDAYRAALFPKVAAGFLTWNNIPLYDLGRGVQSEPEDPKTGPLNLYVRF